MFLFLGALTRHKGVDLLLEAWRAHHHEINGKLLIAGDGALKDDVEQLAKETQTVRYLGYLDDAGKESAILDAGWLVFPSQCVENFSISCIEALVAGRPIVSSALARPPMASDKSLLIFDSPSELSDTLKRAARLPSDDYTEMASAASTDGRRLDWDAHVDTIVRVYETLHAKRDRLERALQSKRQKFVGGQRL